MKKAIVGIFAIAAALALVGTATADTLTVNGSAAMASTTYGLDVYHDNTSGAYVQDNTPDAETVYRFEFLFDPNSISPLTDNWRQTIFGVYGPNPRPDNPANPCPLGASVKIPLMRVFLLMKGGVGQNYFLMGHILGNQCGARQVLPYNPINADGPVKVCGELVIGAPGSGALAVVGPTDACPTSGDAAWSVRDVNNNESNVDLVRLGTLGTNNYALGETGNLYFDEFASYRTLTP